MHDFSHQWLGWLVDSHLVMDNMPAVISLFFSYVIADKNPFKGYFSNQIEIAPEAFFEKADNHYRKFSFHKVYCLFRSELDDGSNILLRATFHLDPVTLLLCSPCIDPEIAFTF